MTLDDMRDNADKAAALLKAMANQHRLMLLCLLNNGEMSVSSLNQQVAIPQSSLSQHLAAPKKLRNTGYPKIRLSFHVK